MNDILLVCLISIVTLCICFPRFVFKYPFIYHPFYAHRPLYFVSERVFVVSTHTQTHHNNDTHQHYLSPTRGFLCCVQLQHNCTCNIATHRIDAKCVSHANIFHVHYVTFACGARCVRLATTASHHHHKVIVFAVHACRFCNQSLQHATREVLL